MTLCLFSRPSTLFALLFGNRAFTRLSPALAGLSRARPTHVGLEHGHVSYCSNKTRKETTRQRAATLFPLL